MSLYFHKSESAFVLSGNTYPHREAIKALGGRFDGLRKVWAIQAPEHEPTLVEQLTAMGALELPSSAPNSAGTPPPATPPTLTQATTPSDDPPTNTLAPQIPEEPTRDTWTVTQVVDAVNKAIQLSFPTRIWIVGEVQSVGFKGGNCYLNLADPDPQGSQGSTISVSAVIWAQTMNSLKKKYPDLDLREILQDGLKIQCSCQIQFYKNRGQVSLLIVDIDPSYTKGALALAREAVLKELRVKGLDTANKRLSLPRIPLKIGLVTAEGSRAASDFLHQLEDGGYPGTVLFVYATMQGERVSPEINQATARLCSEGVDLIVITRGGGSAADLRWFDTMEAALAVAHANVPVIAAIGHHDDTCVVEEISFMRQKTPTAAADFVLGCVQRFQEDLRTLGERLSVLLERCVAIREREERTLAQGLTAGSLRAIAQLEQGLMAYKHRLEFAVQGIYTEQERLLTKLEQELARRDPTPWLEAGWTQLTLEKDSQTKVTSARQLAPGDQVSARLKDGKISLQVSDKQEF